MVLEDYFDFLAPDDIRVKGTRIGIESILYEYTHRGQTAEAISERFQTVTLEQVYATILYYLHYREVTERYLVDWLDFTCRAREEQEIDPPSAVLRLRQLKAEREASNVG
jgi:uncharacterized protein (DUF433 family)